MKFYPVPFVIISFSLFASFYSVPGTVPHKTPPDSIKTITLTFVGDLMCHTPQVDYARVSDDSFDFKPVFRYVSPFLTNTDFTAGNFETVTNGIKSKYTGYPLFNSPDDFLAAIASAGFDLVFTSNNHSLDRGEKGVERTLEVINKNGLQHTGTFDCPWKKDSLEIVSISGIRAAFLSFSYGTNGNIIPEGKDYLINLIDTSLIKKNIDKLKLLNPDIIIVYFHFGDEYSRKPSRAQKYVTEYTARQGADLIIGSHSHVVQPFTFFQGRHKLKDVMTTFSLGNFISNQRERYRDSGIILNVNITKNFSRDSLFLSGYSFIPTWVYKGVVNGKREFLIFPDDPSVQLPSFISKENIKRMKQSFEDTRSVFREIK